MARCHENAMKTLVVYDMFSPHTHVHHTINQFDLDMVITNLNIRLLINQSSLKIRDEHLRNHVIIFPAFSSSRLGDSSPLIS